MRESVFRRLPVTGGPIEFFTALKGVARRCGRHRDAQCQALPALRTIRNPASLGDTGKLFAFAIYFPFSRKRSALAGQ